MKKLLSTRDARNTSFGIVWQVACEAIVFGMLCGTGTTTALAQTGPGASLSQTQALVEKAHNLELRGRMDMASQTWQQVLLADPNNVDALGGLARAAKLAGNSPLADVYIDRLKAINPKDPDIALVQTIGTQQSQTAQLAQAAKLAEAGQYAKAMVIYRQVFGTQPPAGDWALAYYETEAATDEGRTHAISGLRSLMQQYPRDTRYQVHLGRILTYSPKTREQGRKLLEKLPNDQEAQAALRQSLLWDAKNPASAADIRAYLLRHDDTQLATALNSQPKLGTARLPQTREEITAAGRRRAEDAQTDAAYRALNAKRIQEAEVRFKEILSSQPSNTRALAGMGYVRMQQSNFGGAISFLEQAQQDGSKDREIETALSSARFYYAMSEGTIALRENDLTTAEKQYKSALQIRPASPEALEGLGGTLMKAQQPEIAIQVFERYVQVKPSAPEAWRGLLMSKYGAGNAAGALQTDRLVPPTIHAQLMSDPDFLRTLASAYSATGRDVDAQRVLRSALDLPFPSDARSVRVETLLQYAGLLLQANRLDQASGLFRQVLASDPSNIQAWEGLVRVEHAMKQDEQAVQMLGNMPPSSYDVAMRDPGFESTVASVYQAQNKLDIAQSILERAIARQAATGQRPSVVAETQLAGIYLAENNTRQAFPLYRQILTENPQLTDAWKGLLSALHSSGRDQEALAQVQQIPLPVRRTLENDVDYLQTIGSVYSNLGQSQQSLIFVNRVRQHYANQHGVAPAGIDIQNAYLLYNGSNDTGLYRQLMILGGRQDLTDEQRRTVQTIWSLWASRRANAAAAAGNNKRALAILNAAAKAFPDNPGVLKTLASGYARAGLPKQAVLIFKAQDMTSASASDYKAAVGAALAASDTKSAEVWLRFGLNQYPRDAQMLILAAKFEQARGDMGRAAEYYKASLAAMPPPDPGAELANELSQPMLSTANRLPNTTQSQDLANVLGPGAGQDNAGILDIEPAQPAKPYLPTYANSYGPAPVELNNFNGQSDNGQSAELQQNYGNAVPSYMTNPTQQDQAYPAQQSQTRQPPHGKAGTLGEYVPQVEQPAGGYLTPQQPVQPLLLPENSTPDNSQSSSQLPVTHSAQSGGQLSEQAYDAKQIQRITQHAQSQSVSASQGPHEEQTRIQQEGPLTYAPVQAVPVGNQAQLAQASDVYGPYVPYVPPSTNSSYISARLQMRDATSHAENVRRGQSTPNMGMADQSTAPSGVANAPLMQNTQYVLAQSQTVQPQSGQVPQPARTPVDNGQSVENLGQQYPQPAAHPAPRRAVTKKPQRNTSIADRPGMLYPGVVQPLDDQPYPAIGPPIAQGIPPTDAELMARLVPPLRGGYDPTAKGAGPPLTERQQAEFDLNALEASYSAWMGGTGYARYRSGVVGFDRLTDLEASFEASVVAAKNARFTVVAKPVFLSNGVVDTATLSGYTGIIPVLGTLPGNATVTPPQQYASGIGGELQMSTPNLGIAVGYTPYEFLVSNVTGRFVYRPGGGHFSIFADRDSVKETQLSYAGLRDPGSATPFFPGNIWGGVVSTGGGVRVDMGNERSGFYLSGDGASITGYHVLENRKYEGTTGAYFRVKVLPEYGSLNVGATFFGMHYDHNELGLTYGQGGYFSPQSYFLAAVPIGFTGHYKTDWHYVIAGSVGLQTFQSQSAPYYPLDRGIETSSGNPSFLKRADTGLNYSINSEGSYRIADHWYAGGFLYGNNTNDYNTVTGGFFIRYLFKSQFPTENYPTGLFPVDGFRPLRVP